jgi:hypothetical protein
MLRLTNHTPAAFPFVWSRDFGPPYPAGYEPYGPTGAQENWSRFWFGNPELHRFRLEIRRSWWTRILNASVIVNGVVHPLRLGGSYAGSEYWFFDSPARCTPRYTYRFVVRYRDFFTTRTQVFPIFPNILGVTVSRFGETSWFDVYLEATRATSAALYLSEWNAIERLFVQNLGPDPVSVSAAIVGAAPAFFALSTVPPALGVFNCGEMAQLAISFDWHAPGADVGVDAQLMITVRRVADNQVLLQTQVSLTGIILGG